MRLIHTARFEKDYFRRADGYAARIRQAGAIPSPTTFSIRRCTPKKSDESTGLWQARVNRSWRFYFSIEGDAYVLHTIIAHPK